MNAPPTLFDRTLLRLRQARAARGRERADFLLKEAAAEITERLSLMRRHFAVAVDLGTPGDELAKALHRAGNVDRVYQAAHLGGGGRPAVICDEEVLPFRPGALDLVVSALALHWVNDLPGALAQIKRALKPDGLFLAALIGAGTLQELREALMVAEEEVTGGAAARVAPFVDVRDMGTLLTRAGLALPVCDSDSVTVSYPTMFDLIRDLRAMGATNVLAGGGGRPLTRRVAMRAAEIYRERFAMDAGRVRATFNIIYATGWSPHESQQKPLPPGSARMRLADALGTKEISAGEKPETGGAE